MEIKHLMIDSHNVRRNLIGQKGYDTIYETLVHAPKLIGMTAIAPEPIIWESSNKRSGFIPTEEGYITIHIYPDAGKYFADVFSNKEFDSIKVSAYFQLIYGGTMKKRVKIRGDNHFREG